MIGMTELLEMAKNDDHADIMDAVLNPEFDNTTRVHDWRNHIPPRFKGIWDQLSIEVRIVIYLTAYDAACKEEWD